MKQNSPSFTAEMAAMMRSVAHRSRVLKSIVDDPYARSFCGLRALPSLYLNYLFSLFDSSLTCIKIPMVQVGLLCAVCRHAFMERIVIEKMQSGVDQVVLLGAGYDTKSLRILFGDTWFFEIDHPSTQMRKISIVKKLSWKPLPVNYIPCDLSKESPLQSLIDNQFDRSAPAVVLAEGLLSYLEKERIRQLIEVIGTFSKSVTFIFDYRRPLNKSGVAAMRWHRNFKNKGEQYVGLMTANEIEQVLKENGFAITFRKDLVDIATDFLPSFSANDLKGSSEVIIATNESF